MPFITFTLERLPELCLRLGEHLALTGFSTCAAVFIGIPLGISASKAKMLRGAITGGVGMLQTIPSLAMLAVLLVLLKKIGAVPAMIALTLYALLPIVRNTITGIEEVSSSVTEAARGIGMTPAQRLYMVELPLAMSVIIAGIRTAAVVGVGIATLSAFIGAGGLGQFINRGLALSNTNLILLGALPAAVLALIVDGVIASFQWGISCKTSEYVRNNFFIKVLKKLAILSPLFLIVFGYSVYVYGTKDMRPNEAQAVWKGKDRFTIRIGTKNFTEQLILGELMAQVIEAKSRITVERRFNLGGTMICHNAIINNEIDLYAEYTGTALTAILKKGVITNPDKAYNKVSGEYLNRFNLKWLEPFGFNNTYAITVRKEDTKTFKWFNISDLSTTSKTLIAGFTSEFSERPDGYPVLSKVYGLRFKQVLDFDPALMYPAIANKEVDVICAFATDGRIASYNLQILNDDLLFFPPYYAAPVIRKTVLEEHPEILHALNLLSGILDDNTMQRMNLMVDEEKQRVSDVVRDLLAKQVP